MSLRDYQYLSFNEACFLCPRIRLACCLSSSWVAMLNDVLAERATLDDTEGTLQALRTAGGAKTKACKLDAGAGWGKGEEGKNRDSR